MSKKYTKYHFNVYKMTRCQGCQKRFKGGGIGVIFKDVVECKNCGHIFIAQNEQLFSFV